MKMQLRCLVLWDEASAPSGTNNHTVLKVFRLRRLSHIKCSKVSTFFVSVSDVGLDVWGLIGLSRFGNVHVSLNQQLLDR